MITSTRAKKITGITVVTLIALFLFFTKTNRGSSLALYTVAGWHAPIDIRISCGKMTDTRVAEKFRLPLNFDRKSKNGLRGFWYYSYYRQCLFDQGYDFNGRKIERSSISDGVYYNHLGHFSFNVPEETEIISDNTLDVDFDDRLYVSQISFQDKSLILKTYLEQDEIESLDQLPGSTFDFTTGEPAYDNVEIITNGAGVPGVIVTNMSNEISLTAILRDGTLLHIDGSRVSSEGLITIFTTLTNT